MIKLNFLVFSVIAGLSSLAMAFDQGTHKTCSGTVWVATNDHSAPASGTFKLEREPGQEVGKLTMTLEDFSAVGTYKVADDQHVEAKFEIQQDDVQVTGKITQTDESTIAVSGKLASEGQELNFLSFDLKCSNN